MNSSSQRGLIKHRFIVFTPPVLGRKAQKRKIIRPEQYRPQGLAFSSKISETKGEQQKCKAVVLWHFKSGRKRKQMVHTELTKDADSKTPWFNLKGLESNND